MLQHMIFLIHILISLPKNNKIKIIRKHFSFYFFKFLSETSVVVWHARVQR